MDKDIIKYNEAVESDDLRAICDLLAVEISKGLVGATNKIWHKIPVWFIQDNPVVGYYVTKQKGINLMFWSGRIFEEVGLSPEGSFKAAQVKYLNTDQVDVKKLRRWLSEASKKVYNYKDIRKNRGKLSLI